MFLEVMLGVGPFLPRHGGYDYTIFQVEISAGRLLELSKKNCCRFHTEAIGYYWNKIGIIHGSELELRGQGGPHYPLRHCPAQNHRLELAQAGPNRD